MKAVVGRDGRVVVLRNERDEWELPGGKLEPGETTEEAVVREVREELGWDVEPRRLLDVWVYTITPDDVVFIVTYAARLLSTVEPVVSREHSELRLVALDQVDALYMPDGYKRAIRSRAALDL